MPAPSHLLVEILALLFAAGALWDAARTSPRHLATLLTAMAFGLAVELFFVTGYAGYSYGDFVLELVVDGRAMPLWVAAGWGTIVHTAMRATDRMQLHWAQRPALDALLALSLDLSIEPAASSLGWWSFARPGQLLGVPLENFIGWMLIVGSFSALVRASTLLVRRESVLPSIAVPVLSFAAACAFMVMARIVWGHLILPNGGELPTFLVMAGMLALVSLPAALRSGSAGPRPWLLTAVPLGFHGVCLTLLVASGALASSPATGVLLVALAVLSVAAFRHPPVLREV